MESEKRKFESESPDAGDDSAKKMKVEAVGSADGISADVDVAPLTCNDPAPNLINGGENGVINDVDVANWLTSGGPVASKLADIFKAGLCARADLDDKVLKGLRDIAEQDATAVLFQFERSLNSHKSSINNMSGYLVGIMRKQRNQGYPTDNAFPGGDTAPTSDPRYKTSLCTRFAEDGVCSYGKGCSFAHGKAELRSRSQNQQQQQRPPQMRGMGGPMGGMGMGGFRGMPMRNMAPWGAPPPFFHGGMGRPPNMNMAPNGRPAAAPGGTGMNSDGRFKTRMCKRWASDGTCSYGEKCAFAHGQAELRQSSTAGNGNGQQQPGPFMPPRAMHQMPQLMVPVAQMQQQPTHGGQSIGERPIAQGPPAAGSSSTKVCRQFESNGTCSFGDKCHYAHGSVEAAQPGRNFKTRMCRQFEANGCCTFDDRCHYAHGAHELRTVAPRTPSAMAQAQQYAPQQQQQYQQQQQPPPQQQQQQYQQAQYAQPQYAQPQYPPAQQQQQAPAQQTPAAAYAQTAYGQPAAQTAQAAYGQPAVQTAQAAYGQPAAQPTNGYGQQQQQYQPAQAAYSQQYAPQYAQAAAPAAQQTAMHPQF